MLVVTTVIFFLCRSSLFERWTSNVFYYVYVLIKYAILRWYNHPHFWHFYFIFIFLGFYAFCSHKAAYEKHYRIFINVLDCSVYGNTVRLFQVYNASFRNSSLQWHTDLLSGPKNKHHCILCWEVWSPHPRVTICWSCVVTSDTWVGVLVFAWSIILQTKCLCQLQLDLCICMCVCVLGWTDFGGSNPINRLKHTHTHTQVLFSDIYLLTDGQSVFERYKTSTCLQNVGRVAMWLEFFLNTSIFV